MNESEVTSIIADWSTTQDLWQNDMSWMGETYDDALVYPPSFMTKKPGYNYRTLPDYHAEQARRYIAVLCERYPLQLRVLMSLPLWGRFCEMWNRTGDKGKAMRAI